MLLEDYRFKGSNGVMWIAKKGSKVDGASISRALWSIVGGPLIGMTARDLEKYRELAQGVRMIRLAPEETFGAGILPVTTKVETPLQDCELIAKAIFSLRQEPKSMTEPTQVPKGPFYFDPDHDTNDGKPWDETELEDLADAPKSGDTVEQAARFLCRSGTVDEVRQKAKELGLPCH